MGHIARDCAQVKRMFKCTLCGSNQHTRGRCPEEHNNENQGLQKNAEALQAQVKANCVSKNPFVKSVSLN